MIYNSSHPQTEYNNPALFPGMYPVLFPYGTGGFEVASRPTPLNFETQAEYFLDIESGQFRNHWSFLFVTLNIIQRRKAHLHVHLMTKAKDFPEVAKQFSQIKPETLDHLADKIQSEQTKNLSDSEQEAMKLFSKVKTITSHIPGSVASKIALRNDIRSYFMYFGCPQFFFTFNPSAVNNPAFHLMYGDTTIDLSTQEPDLPDFDTRARRVASDPVAASDFFEFSYKLLFSTLFAWDFEKQRSKPEGGILGHIRAFYGTSE
ncbi:hypothetical protein K435DRAFT_581494, partial [Dendrothele bispora CBS 962.96]